MACFHPLTGWMSKGLNQNGNHYVVFKPSLGQPGSKLKIPCGRCIGCRLEHSRQWAMRCYHESTLYTDNSFITLTYNDDHLPFDGSIDKKHFQLFMKRLRKKLHPRTIRYFGCAEYGVSCLVCHKNKSQCDQDLSHAFVETLGRPHYHACIFNYDFPDKQLYSEREGVKLYTSEILSSIWSDPKTKSPLGFVTVGEVSFESAAYVARYVTKKITGDLSHDHYQKPCPYTGELIPVEPERPFMSRRPGIASAWFDTYSGDLHKDYLHLRGHRMRPARYYDYLLHKDDPDELAVRKLKRKDAALSVKHDNTPRRLKVKEILKQRQFSKLHRNL